MAAAPGGQIGPFVFLTLDPLLSPPQIMYENITSPFEDGVAASAMRVGSPGPERLTAVSDLLTASAVAQALRDYVSIKGTVQDITIQTSGGPIFFDNYWIWEVKQLPVGEALYSQVVSGGLVLGNYILATEWVVEHATGV